MIEVSFEEFRKNQEKYMEIADLNGQLIIQTAEGKSYALTPLNETDKYFMDPAVLADVQEGVAQFKTGKTTKIAKEDFDKLLSPQKKVR